MMTKLKAKKGRPFKERPSRKELGRFYVKEERSIREIAGLLNCSKDLIYRALQEYGIETRSNIKRSRFRAYKSGFLKRKVKDKGYRQTARELKINEWTLRAYLRSNPGKADDNC